MFQIYYKIKGEQKLVMILYRGQQEDWPLKPSGYREIPPENELKVFSQSLIRNKSVFKHDYRIVANLIFEIFNNYDLDYEPSMPEFKTFLRIKCKDTLIKEIDNFMLNFITPNSCSLNNFLEDFSYFQHYGKKTPMLDFTENFDSALKFAGTKHATKMEDGFLKINDFPIEIGTKATLFVFSPELYFENAQPWLLSYMYSWDSGKNKNIINQKGICIFCFPSDCNTTFSFLNCYQVYNIFNKARIDYPIFRLSKQILDDIYNIDTLYKLGAISYDLFKENLNKFAKQYNMPIPIYPIKNHH